MGRITRDYLHGHRLAPHQCATNMFQILGCVDVLNKQMNLGLSWHDVVHLYECHCLSESYYLKSRSDEVRLISCLPKSNKGLKDDYLIVFGTWHDGLRCPIGWEHQVGHSKIKSPGGDLSFEFPFTCFGLGFDCLLSRTDITLPLDVLPTKCTLLRGLVWSTSKLSTTS